MSSSKTGNIPSSGGSTEHKLEDNTSIVVLGASGDLAKKKVSTRVQRAMTTAQLDRAHHTEAARTCTGITLAHSPTRAWPDEAY